MSEEQKTRKVYPVFISGGVRQRFIDAREKCWASDNPFLRAAAQSGKGAFGNAVVDLGLTYIDSLLKNAETYEGRIETLERKVKTLESLLPSTEGENNERRET